MPLITAVPFFVNVPQFDMFNLMYDTGTLHLCVADSPLPAHGLPDAANFSRQTITSL